MKNLFICLLLASLAVVVGCSNNDSGTNSGGENTANSYTPMSVGSNWTYNVGSGTKKRTVFATSSYNGKSYFQVADSPDTLQLRHEGGITYSLMPDSTFLGVQDYPVVNENVGASWEYDLNFLVSTSHVIAKTVAGGLTRTVNGHTYSDVIQLHEDVISDVFGFSDTARLDHYFAKGIGEIEIVDPSGSESETLVSYEIK
jgi:hypothetical protein